MLQFLQPLGAAAIGVALFVYGLIHSLLHRPPGAAFQAAAHALPAVSAVMLFVLGLAAIAAGLVLLIIGARGIRRRTREIRQVFGPPSRYSRRSDADPQRHARHEMYDDDWNDPPAYR